MSHVSAPLNSVRKGDLLEDAVFNQLSQDVKAGRFAFAESACKIFQKKGYYSKDRESDIVFDISIEFYLPDQPDWTVLFLIECKNYAHKVPVSDIEEFFQKTQQVGAGGVKAIVVSSNSYQEGAVTFARSKRIGLARHFSDRDLEWVLNRSPSTLQVQCSTFGFGLVPDALTSERFISRYFDYHCIAGDIHATSLPALILEILGGGNELPEEDRAAIRMRDTQAILPWVPFIPSVEIEARAKSFSLVVSQQGSATPLDLLCEYLERENGLEVGYASLSPGVLATVSFDPLRIVIDPAQNATEGRARFTLAHELGHICLGHGQFMSRDTLRDIDTSEDALDVVALADIARLEWQANYFAACLLLPARALVAEVQRQAKMRNIKNKGFGLLYLDDQRCNRDVFMTVSAELASRFKVSRQVVKLRLKELGLLHEVRISRTALEAGSDLLRRIIHVRPAEY